METRWYRLQKRYGPMALFMSGRNGRRYPSLSHFITLTGAPNRFHSLQNHLSRPPTGKTALCFIALRIFPQRKVSSRVILGHSPGGYFGSLLPILIRCRMAGFLSLLYAALEAFLATARLPLLQLVAGWSLEAWARITVRLIPSVFGTKG